MKRYTAAFFTAALVAAVSLSIPAWAQEEDVYPRVTGNDCVPIEPEIGYRPSLYECNGAAAILLSGRYRSAYSVVVRRTGQFNDRDPNNPTCTTNRCSPYKVQKKIELPEYQVNCLGDSGFSDSFVGVTRISIKFFGDVTNSLDPNQFQQYCLPNKRISVN